MAWKVKYTIDISPATPEADWRLRVTINSSNFDYSLCNIDGSDIRFSDTSNNPLSYWIEAWNPLGNSYIWVNIPTISTSTIWMWAGDESSVSESNYSTTLQYFAIADVNNYTNMYSSFFVFVNGMFLIAVKENGTVEYDKATTSKYTWAVLSRSQYWDNPAGPSWSYPETGWNDYGVGAWNYVAQGDAAATHTMVFIGNGRSGSTNYGSVYHYDLISISGTVEMLGPESGAGAFTGGTVVFYTAKGRASETITVTMVSSNIAGAADLDTTVRLYDRTTGMLLGETISSPTDGTFAFNIAIRSNQHFAMSISGTGENAIIKDKILGTT